MGSYCYLFFALSFLIAELLVKRSIDYIKDLIAILVGVALGIIVNPYFPQNVNSILFNLKRGFEPPLHLAIGVEWKPYTTPEFISVFWGGSILLFITILATSLIKDIKLEEVALLIILSGFLFLTFKSSRYIEYLPVFTGMTSALLIGKRWNKKPLLILFLILTIIGLVSFKEGINKVRGFPAIVKECKEAAVWLHENTNQGEIVFNTRWWDFPCLFFFNVKNYYVVGLDPIYMYNYDKNLYFLYQNVVSGLAQNIPQVVKNRFQSKYILAHIENKKLLEKLLTNKDTTLIFKNNAFLIFRIK